VICFFIYVFHALVRYFFLSLFGYFFICSSVLSSVMSVVVYGCVFLYYAISLLLEFVL